MTQCILRGVLALLLGTTIGNPLLNYQVLRLICLCQVCIVVDIAILSHMQLSSSMPMLAPASPAIIVSPAVVFNLAIYVPLIVTNLVSTLIIGEFKVGLISYLFFSLFSTYQHSQGSGALGS